jgi:hypothetical protein
MKHDGPDEQQDVAELADRIEHLRHTQALVGDSSFSDMVTAFYREFGSVVRVDYTVCEEMLDWLRDAGYVGRGRGSLPADLPQWIAKFHKILRYIKAHPTSTAIYAVLHIWDDPLLDAINGNMNQDEFAASIGVTKAAVNNAVMDGMKHFGTAPRKDQRQAQARQRMSAAAIQRLERTTKG